ncbi:MAG: CHAP domain-containing protein [Myxococcales bacterium]|jgi:surface antigen|nr:CHAP domain-containing protein [Myxococcales bacterium]
MKSNRWAYSLSGLFVFAFTGMWSFNHFSFNSTHTVGQEIDSLNGVVVFYNGGVDNVSGRNLTANGYNLGLKYQCVEFVKRYYYEHLKHEMPDSYGHAIDFFDKSLADGQKNKRRALTQYANPSQTKPKVDDLVVLSGTVANKYGHVAIISDVMENEVEIIQQNPGPFGKSRERFLLENSNGKWRIDNKRILGWLRKE